MVTTFLGFHIIVVYRQRGHITLLKYTISSWLSSRFRIRFEFRSSCVIMADAVATATTEPEKPRPKATRRRSSVYENASERIKRLSILVVGRSESDNNAPMHPTDTESTPLVQPSTNDNNNNYYSNIEKEEEEEITFTGEFLGIMEDIFEFEERDTTIHSELFTGVIHFLSTVYLMAVVPRNLVNGGYDRYESITALVTVCATASILFGIFANLPIVIATPAQTSIFLVFAQRSMSMTKVIFRY